MPQSGPGYVSMEYLSSLSGSISLASWVFVLVRCDWERESITELMKIIGTSANRELQVGERRGHLACVFDGVVHWRPRQLLWIDMGRLGSYRDRAGCLLLHCGRCLDYAVSVLSLCQLSQTTSRWRFGRASRQLNSAIARSKFQ